MVSNKKQALAIAMQTRTALEQLYGERLRGVYLYGSAARDQLDENSDIDIAIILDEIPDRFEEHERTSKLGSQISLDANTLVSFMFVPEADYQQGRYAVYRAIKREGIAV